jgi:hypothetical protein
MENGEWKMENGEWRIGAFLQSFPPFRQVQGNDKLRVTIPIYS